MRPRRVLFAALLAAVGSAHAAVIDTTALGDPPLACRDFDDYVNGAWKAAAQIPPDRARIGSFETLRDTSRAVVEQALASALADPAQLDTPGKQLAARFYASGVDVDAIEARGLRSLRPLLDQIDRLSDRRQLAAVLAQLTRAGIAAPLAVRVDTDAKNRRRYILALDQGGLGLPDRDDYFRDDPRTVAVRASYERYRTSLAALVGDAEPQVAASASFALQAELAESAQRRVERRDPYALYQLNTLATIEQRAPGFDWSAYFAAIGAPQPGDFNVASPAFIARFARAAAEAPLSQWRAYLRERLLDELAPTLPEAYRRAHFDYRSNALRGTERPMRRSEEVINLITGPFGSEPLAEGLGQLYVARAFSPQAKERALAMIADIRAAMRVRISKLDWMNASTKERALAKLDAMVPKIGYPDAWRTYEGLAIAPDDFAGNWLRARQWLFNYRLADLGRPVDRTRWFSSPQLVNAFAGSLNEIVFPAAILQPPFFHAEGDAAVNFGAIGAVIGHEITHHFDDRGRRFDSHGNLADWWVPDDDAAYRMRAAKLAQQYSEFKPLPGESIDGLQTLGENISDLSGILIAYDALERALARAPVAPIDGLTQPQRFFISYATIWRERQRTAALIDQLRTGFHSPPRYRILGTLVNVPAFAWAFGCPPDAPMARAETERVRIW
jgi:predicted metalloendopeptidase